jgi:hypothetical protein
VAHLLPQEFYISSD